VDLWMLWLDAIRSLLSFLASDAGLGVGFAIFVLTVAMRSALLPLSWSSAYRGCIRQKKMARLQPQLKQLKEECGGEPRLYAERLKQLYKDQGLTFVDGRALLGMLVQAPVLLGMYQVLRDGADGAGFLWIRNLSKPDLCFALVVGAATALMMAANPDVPEQLRLLLIVVPAILAAITALKFSSALAIYWAATNCFSAVQTLLLHVVVQRRIKSGAILI
jgi:YidC/Oxa1 family membrane protein insertase